VNKVPMASIQQFVNLAAGAIHRTDPSALVTNGAWSLIAETDVTLPAKPADLQTRLNSMTAAEKQEIEDNFYARYRYRTTASEILAPYAASDFNYYRDDRLKAAGGDSLGTLDFYCSHYYQDGRPVFLIPFTHQASVYGLTKPMVIAEFSPTATNGIPHPALYPTLHDLGYAGGTTWSWYGANPGFDQDTLKARTLVELSSMFSQYPDLVQIDPVSGTIYSFAAQPAILDSGETSLLSWKTAVGSAPTLNGGSVAIRDTARVTLGATTPYRLSTSGTNPESLTVTVQVYPSGRIISFTGLPGTIGVGDPVVLKWKAAHSSVVTLNGSGEPRSDSLTVHPDTTSKYTLLSHGSVNDSASVTIAVFPINQLNRALGKAVSTSGNSTNSALANPANAVDGDTTTAWGSSSSNNEWFDINLGQNFEIQRVTIIWGNNYATTYILSVSSDNSNWTDLRSITNGAGRTEVLDSLNHDGQYVLLSLGQRFLTTTGFLIKEIQVYGIARPLGVDNAASNLPDRFALYQNYPNPFNPSTTIRFALPVRSDVRIAVYNVLGQRVATLVQGSMDAGYHSLSWAPSVASGIYFCHMEATSEGTPGQRYQQTLKLMLLK